MTLWPEEYHNRWTDWMLKILITERISVFGCCQDSGKTRRVSKFILCDYFCFPDTTLILMTSTTARGLEMRVWGDIKSLWERAKERYPQLEGNPVDAKHGIFTDNLAENARIRDQRKGIIGIPTLTSDAQYDGAALREFAGIKQKRRRLIGDEVQHVPTDYLKVLYAMNSGNFKAAFCGNMVADNGKALDRVAEPEGGWSSLPEIKTSSAWRNKYGGITLNLVGTDSPNLDPDTRNEFPGMINQEAIDRAAAQPGAKDSVEWWSQIMGVRKSGVISERVLTVEMVQAHNGFKEVIWSTAPTLRACGVDAGFGGDECVNTYIECGTEVGGIEVMRFVEQKVIPILVSSPLSAEDQIAEATKKDCAERGIPDANVFIEAGMRATLAVSFGRIMSPAINAINFGGPATQRPVSNELFVFDERTQQRRLKTCYEHYSKFVTELAFTVRMVVECGQARTFPMQAAEEFQKRKTDFVYGDRHEVESKIKYKERNAGKSPNWSDSAMIAVEGARRLGFAIQRMADPDATPTVADDWLEEAIDEHRKRERKRELTYD
jgi:hypothetical protein